MSNNCLKAKSFILLLLMKSNRQKQRFCHPKMADLKAWSHGVRNIEIIKEKRRHPDINSVKLAGQIEVC